MRVQVGDIFEVKLDGNKKQYFQYVANDVSQLNSSVIKIFKTKYDASELLEVKRIVNDSVDFYAHVFLRNGVKLGFWNKIGGVSEAEMDDIFFRNTNDYGNPKIKVSQNWYVWKINKPFLHVGKLEGKYRNAEIGVVVPPAQVVMRMQNGSYDINYTAYE
jgi:hypothetical protein